MLTKYVIQKIFLMCDDCGSMEDEIFDVFIFSLSLDSQVPSGDPVTCGIQCEAKILKKNKNIY